MANQNATQNNDHDPNVIDDSDESQDIPVARLMPRVDYKSQYIALKKKLKFLLYVSEFIANKFSQVFSFWKKKTKNLPFHFMNVD